MFVKANWGQSDVQKKDHLICKNWLFNTCQQLDPIKAQAYSPNPHLETHVWTITCSKRIVSFFLTRFRTEYMFTV